MCYFFQAYGGLTVHPIHFSTREILENRGFDLVSSAEFLAKHTFNIGGWSALEDRPNESDFGVARMIVSNVALARQILMENNMPARIDDVVVIEIDDRPRSLEKILSHLQQASVIVNYLYGFALLHQERACMVTSFSDNQKALINLKEYGVCVLTEADLNIQNSISN